MNGGSGPIDGRKVLTWLIAFFAIIAAVNAVFIYKALKTYPGLSTENAYTTGLAYNSVLGAADAQRALGWQVKLERARVDAQEGLRLSVADRKGAPIRTPRATAELRRPAHRGDDRRIEFVPTAEPGIYTAFLPADAKGAWDVVVLIARPDGDDFRAEYRLWVDP